MAELKCIVVTPETTVMEQSADFVALPLFDGEIGIAPRHSPLIGRLGFGELRLKTGGKVLRYYVDGGFVQVARDEVALLTNRAVAAEQIDASVVEEQLSASRQRPAHSDEAIDARDQAVAQARAQLRVANRAK